MARKSGTATKKKPAAKGGKKGGKKADDLEDIEKSIEEDLGKDFDFEESDEKKVDDNLVGKTVTFETTNEDGKTIKVTGKVTEHDAEGNLVVEDEEAFWEAEADDVEVQDEEKPKGKGKTAPATKGKKAAKTDDDYGDLADETADETAEEEVEEEEVEEEEAGATEASSGTTKLIPLVDIKIPKKKPRAVNKESKKYKVILADMKKRKQRDPIRVQSFAKPVLVNGLRRLSAAEELGWTEILCIEDEGVSTIDDRLWNGLMDNEAREDMRWTELAKTFAELTVAGERTSRSISRALGISESEISKMIAAVGKGGLAKGLIEIADHEDCAYSKTVFLELVGTDKKVQNAALKVMQEGGALTIQDVRNLKKGAKKDAKEEEGEEHEEEKRGGKKKDDETSGGATYRNLPKSDTGSFLKVTVHDNGTVEIKATIEWAKKTYRSFDPVEEIKGLFDLSYADDECRLSSDAELIKALNAARSEIGS